jgi:hypothetical protein
MIYNNALMLFDIENTNINYVKKTIDFCVNINASVSIISIHEFDNLLPDECPVDILNPISNQNLINQSDYILNEINNNNWSIKSFFISRGDYISNVSKIIENNNIDLIIVNKKGSVMFERKIKSIISKIQIDILRS